MSTNIPVMEKPAVTRTEDEEKQPSPVVIMDGRVRRRLKIAAAISTLVGVALLAVPFVTDHYPLTPGFFVIAGISVILLSILLYYLSPAKFLRTDVCDAMCVTGTGFMYEVVGPMASGNRCVYIPSGVNGDVRILLSFSEGRGEKSPKDKPDDSSGSHRTDQGMREISITPPGYGLLEHAKHLGAAFTPDNLEDEIRDVLVNGFELAGGVKVKKSGSEVTIEMRNTAIHSMCRKLRGNKTGLCESIGCPLCSFATCMVVEGTGKKAIINGTRVKGKTIWLSLSLI